jgi:hypothetical protein
MHDDEDADIVLSTVIRLALWSALAAAFIAFSMNELGFGDRSAMETHSQGQPVQGVTGQGVTGQGVTGQGVTGQGVTGQGVTGQGVTGQGVTGQGVTGHRAPLPVVGALTESAVSLFEKGDLDGARERVNAGLGIDPRNQALLAQRLTIAIAESDAALIVSTLADLRRVDPRDAGVYDQALAALYEIESARPFLARYLAEDDHAKGLRRSLAASASIDDTLIATLQGSEEFALLISRLTGEGKYDRAFGLWFSNLSPEARSAYSLPNNQALIAAANTNDPFHWTIDARQSEWIPGGGVFAATPGNRAITHLRQVIMAAPGPYRLEAELSGQMRESGARFLWHFACLGGPSFSQTLPVTALSDERQKMEWEIELNPQCSAYQLEFRSEPSVFPFSARSELHSVVLKPFTSGQGDR